jgi:putative transposon-encoded protein
MIECIIIYRVYDMYVTNLNPEEYKRSYSFLLTNEINIYYVHTTSIIMVRRMIATITQIESVVTPSGNSGHVVVLKAWIGKEAIVTLKEKESKGKGKKK